MLEFESQCMRQVPCKDIQVATGGGAALTNMEFDWFCINCLTSVSSRLYSLKLKLVAIVSSLGNSQLFNVAT